MMLCRLQKGRIYIYPFFALSWISASFEMGARQKSKAANECQYVKGTPKSKISGLYKFADAGSLADSYRQMSS